MSTAAHTPAPWRVEKLGDPKYFHGANVFICARGGNICEVDPCANPAKAFNDPTLPDVTDPQHSQIQLANARLIAAAPELLEALREMTDLAAGPIGGVTVAAKRNVITKARTAIARATGGAA